jgi:hypothetical protein
MPSVVLTRLADIPKASYASLARWSSWVEFSTSCSTANPRGHTVSKCASGRYRMPSYRESNTMALAIASPVAGASVRICACRASGWKGLPFSMPSGVSIAMKNRSRSSTGSLSMAWARRSQ